MRKTQFTLAPLALAAVLAVSVGSMAHAQTAQAISVSIATQPLGQALNEFARQAGLQLSFPAALVTGRTAPPVSGSFTAQQALDRLLAGSGLEARVNGNEVVVRRMPAPESSSATTLSPVTVTASANSTGDLPKAYAGGQVAQGGSLGLLGNTRVVDSPFSQSSFTAEFIQNSQAQTLGEALESSPSVRRNGSRFNQNDTYTIRGFGVTVGSDIAYDGMYGITNTRRNAMEGIERIEVLRGPSALLNGLPAGGSVGGTINLVPKRPSADPLTDVTLSYSSASQRGAHADLSRRFGPDDRFGVRTNLAHREGATGFDFNRDRSTHASVAMDYIGDKLRLFGHLNQEDQRLDAPLFGALTLSPGLQVPSAPDAGRNFNPPFVYTETSRLVGLARAEYDFSETWTGSLAFGAQNLEDEQVTASGQRLLNSHGDYSRPSRNRLTRGDRNGRSVDGKLTGSFQTGSVKHRLAIGYSGFRSKQSVDTINAPGRGSNSNIYHPDPNAEPIPVFDTAPTNARQNLSFGGLAIADTLQFLDDRILLTIGLRRQQIKVVDNGSLSYDRAVTSPSVGLVIKPWKNWSLYANYIEGLSQGQRAPADAVNADEVLPPFVSKQHEIGIKHDSGNLLTTISYFEIKRPSAITDPVTRVFSANGEQRNRGLEIETFGEILRGTRFIGGFTLIDAKLSKTQGAVNEGNFAPEVPKFSANLGLEWDTSFAPGLTLTARAIHTGSQYVDPANTQKIPSWTRFDVGARYALRAAGRPLTLRASITNLFDRNYFESTRLFTGSARSISLSATVSF
ncbi:TonB-dependent receptor [Ottowia thiooxydans]|uniref:Iron complex outermembrane receptor protein n=1 Tax=Ottowia thiooxydans TaxID=219182 RepID=A0ABV2QA37_9BURK